MINVFINFLFTSVLLFCTTFCFFVSTEVDNACINQHLRQIGLIEEDVVRVPTNNRLCESYINGLTENFYKLWSYHYKYQQSRMNKDVNIRCFVQESKKWQLHDRYLLDLLLRDKELLHKKIFQRNSILYDRLKKEAAHNCNLSPEWSYQKENVTQMLDSQCNQ